MMYGTQEFSVGMLPSRKQHKVSCLAHAFSDNTIWEADFPGRDDLVMSGITNTIES